MDDADLEKLTIKPGTLNPKFHRDVTDYKVTLASNVEKLALDYFTSDSNASTQILNHDGGRTIPLKEGAIISIKIEVTAEDGTTKVYQIDARRLSAKDASLNDIKLTVGTLQPAFDSRQLNYSCMVPYSQDSIKVTPSVLDKKIAVTVNGQDPATIEVALNVGETAVDIEVTSADGSNKVIYSVTVVKQWLAHAVEFVNKGDQAKFECPISLGPSYRPIGIAGSDPKHVFSEPIINELTRTCKQDPLDGTPLEDKWQVVEKEMEQHMSTAVVFCLFAYRGCSEKTKYCQLGSHIQQCKHRPKITEEHEETVACKDCSCKIVKGEEDWHKSNICSSNHTNRDIKHSVKEHAWQKKLQESGIGGNVEELMEQAMRFCKQYKENLPKKGQTKKFEVGKSPVDMLHNAAVTMSGAIKQAAKDPELHFQLGLILEEHYHAKDMFGISKEDDDIDEGVADLSLNPNAKESSKEDDIQAICHQRGAGTNAPLSRQLQAIDEEYRFLLDSGQSGKADYVQGLYVWKSKQATQDGKAAQAASDQETPLGKAYLKYMDALSLQQNNVTYNLHVGRLLLLQGKIAEAIERFQVALSMKPALPIVRLYLGLALALQKDGPGARLKETIHYLHDGVQHVLGLAILEAEEKADKSNVRDLQAENVMRRANSHIIRAFIHLGKLLQKSPQEKMLSPKQLYHSGGLLAAQNLCSLVHRGGTYQSMEWLLLDAHTNLLEIMMKEEKADTHWIARRCQNISSIIRSSSIPQSQEVLELQEKTCQKGVIAQPTNSYALFLLGNSQLAMYENSPQKEDGKKALEDARLSFRASIAQEGKPSIGGEIPEQLSKQTWWQEHLKKEEAASKATTEKKKDVKPAAGTTPVKRGAAATSTGTRGTVARTRGTPAAKTPATRGASRGAARGGNVAKPARGKTPPLAKGGAPAGRGGSQSKVAATPQQSPPVAPAQAGAKPQATPVPANAPLNRMSYPPRLGLARALSKDTDDFSEAQMLYSDVIVMAPQVHDAYIELADLLVKTEPLKAVDVYAKYPFNEESTFDDAFLHGEIVRLLMKQEQFDDSRLEKHMIAWGRVMGLGCLEKYVEILDSKFKSELLKKVYAGVNRKSVDDPDLQAFFKFKMWL